MNGHPKGLSPALRNPPPTKWQPAGGDPEEEIAIAVTVGMNPALVKAFNSYLMDQLETQEGCYKHYSRCIRDSVDGNITHELSSELGSFLLHRAGFTEREIDLDRHGKLKGPARHGGWNP